MVVRIIIKGARTTTALSKGLRKMVVKIIITFTGARIAI